MEACAAAGVELTLVNELGHLGLAAVVAGHLRQAEDWAGRCLTARERSRWGELPQAAAGYLTLVLVAVARQDLDEAERNVSRGLATQRPDREALLSLRLCTMQATLDTSRAGTTWPAASSARYARGSRPPMPRHWCTVGSPADRRSWLWRPGRTPSFAGGWRCSPRLDAPPTRPSSSPGARLTDGDADGADQLLVPLAHEDLTLQAAVGASVGRPGSVC